MQIAIIGKVDSLHFSTMKPWMRLRVLNPDAGPFLVLSWDIVSGSLLYHCVVRCRGDGDSRGCHINTTQRLAAGSCGSMRD